MRFRAVRAGVAAGIAVVSLAAPAPAQAPAPAPGFPPSLQREALLLWLQRETDIQPDRVVAVTSQALTSIVSSFPAGGGLGPRVVIRAEALSPDTYARTAALSWHVSLNADCQNRRLKLGETTGYPERNLLGERKMLRPAENEWRTPEKGTALENAWRAACEPDFKGPLQGSAVKLAGVDGPPPPAGAQTAAAATAAAAPAPTATPPAKAALPRPASAKPTPTPTAKAAAPQPAPAAAAPARSPAPRPAVGGLVAQVGASTSEAEARGLLSALRARVGERPTWIETAEVAGKTWRRAVVGGFADRNDANRFCAGLAAAGKACFVRAGKPG